MVCDQTLESTGPRSIRNGMNMRGNLRVCLLLFYCFMNVNDNPVVRHQLAYRGPSMTSEFDGPAWARTLFLKVIDCSVNAAASERNSSPSLKRVCLVGAVNILSRSGD